MNKPGTKMLCSQRCYLRKLEISDSQQLFENVYSDPKVAGYMSWNLYNNVTEVENYLRKWQESYKQNVLSRLGFTCEATLRKRDKTDFGIEDCLSYSLLRCEKTIKIGTFQTKKSIKIPISEFLLIFLYFYAIIRI